MVLVSCLRISLSALMITVSLANPANYSLDVLGEAHDGYYISLGIGRPPQRISLLIDTGSSNFAVAATAEQTDNSFDWTKSKTFHKTDRTLTIRYTEGSWNGFIAYDDVDLCAGSNPNCFHESQFACITHSKNIFAENSSWAGILGLAYPSIAKPDDFVKPFFTGLFENHHLSSKLFSLSLCGPFLENARQHVDQGKLHLGYVDDRFYRGRIMYTPVVKEWYYEVTLTGLKVGNASFEMSCSELNNDKTIIDTGTTFLSFPSVVHNWIVAQMKSALATELDHFPAEFWSGQAEVCSSHRVISAFPTITLEFYHTNNSTFSVLLSSVLYLLKYELLSNGKLCYKLGLSPSKKGTVVGASVLKGFYVVFDQGGQRIGFANSTCSDYSIVTENVYRDSSSLQCRYVDSMSLALKILAYAVVTVALAFALPLLYMLSSWIYHNILKRRYSSESSSLVSESL